MIRSVTKILILLAALSLSSPTFGDQLVAARTLQANQIIGAEDVVMVSTNRPPLDDLTAAGAVGQETRKVFFKGQAMTRADIGAPALVTRNQVVLLVFNQFGLSIETEGRALERGGLGDIVRVMNLGSRKTVTGKIDRFGAVHVGK